MWAYGPEPRVVVFRVGKLREATNIADVSLLSVQVVESIRDALVGDRRDGTLHVLGARSVAVFWVLAVSILVVGYEFGGCPLAAWAAIRRAGCGGGGVVESLPVLFSCIAELLQGGYNSSASVGVQVVNEGG